MPPQVPPQLPSDLPQIQYGRQAAKVWLTTFNHEDGSAKHILQPQPDVYFRDTPDEPREPTSISRGTSGQPGRAEEGAPDQAGRADLASGGQGGVPHQAGQPAGVPSDVLEALEPPSETPQGMRAVFERERASVMHQASVAGPERRAPSAPAPEPRLRCDPGVRKSCRAEPPPDWVPPDEMTQQGVRSAAVAIRDDALQRMVGFGASVTQATAEILIGLKHRSPPVYDQVMMRMFSTEDGAAGLSFLRFPIGGSDFASELYSEDDLQAHRCLGVKACTARCSAPGGTCSADVERSFTPLSDDCACSGLDGNNRSAAAGISCQPCCCVPSDYQLRQFRLRPATLQILEVVRDAKKIAPDLSTMATPWSPPSWMKVGRSLVGGDDTNTLVDSDEAFAAYAAYLRRYVGACREQGVELDYIGLQNEPLQGQLEYPAMYLSVEQASKLGKLVKEQLGDSPRVLAYEHNWVSQKDGHYPQDVLQEAPGVFSGTAFHCYGGNMSRAQDALHKLHPELPIFMTECSGSYPDDKCDIAKGMHGFYWNYNWQMSNLFLGAAQHWTSAALRWNLVLDEKCGPTLPGLAYQWGQPIITIPSTAKTPNDIMYNQDFYTIAHMSTFVRPGMRRLPADVFGVPESDAIITAFKDDEAGTIVAYAFNKDAHNKLSLEISHHGKVLAYTVPSWGTAVFQFNPSVA